MNYLPDTALTALAIGKQVYAYAQTVNGVLVECEGELTNVSINSVMNSDIYSFMGQNHVLARYQRDDVAPGAPKLFTPLAAANIGSTRYLFYVDDANIIRGVTSPTSGTRWAKDNILAGLAINCAHYSQLTAITISNNNFQAILLYYQSPKRDAAIEMLGYSTKNNVWVKGPPDMTPLPPPPPPPPPRVVDPPLYGTSITAVPVRNALQVIPNSTMPVVFLQWDDLSLAHAQEQQIKVISSLQAKFAPHTSITAVDDRENLYCFYTSTRNNNIRMIVIKDGTTLDPQTVATPTPRSSIAAVLPTNDRIVLFYQSLNASLGKVELLGMTFRKDATSPANRWPVSQATPTTTTLA